MKLKDKLLAIGSVIIAVLGALIGYRLKESLTDIPEEDISDLIIKDEDLTKKIKVSKEESEEAKVNHSKVTTNVEKESSDIKTSKDKRKKKASRLIKKVKK